MLPMLFASRFQRRYRSAGYLVSNADGNSKFLWARGFCDRVPDANGDRHRSNCTEPDGASLDFADIAKGRIVFGRSAH
ncbi:hypothetical protein CF98_21495 [Halopseudomonas bauzanensis]|nr:hypothetical protein CF98_21495 [Halopseudomonas bauzanensis]